MDDEEAGARPVVGTAPDAAWSRPWSWMEWWMQGRTDVAAGTLFGTGSTAFAPLATLSERMAPRGGCVRHRDIAYGEGPRRTLDVYAPAKRDADSPAPVVVFFYGGAWSTGRRDFYSFVGEALTELGFVVVIPDYRLYPDVRFPAFIEDGAAVLAWAQGNIGAYGGRAEGVVLMGHSAGAHIAAMLIADDHYLAAAGVDRRTVCGFVGLAGAYAIDLMRGRTTQPIFANASRPAMPLGLIDGDEPPMLLLHGGQDATVYPENSRTLAERVRARGGRVTVVEYADKGHIGLVMTLAARFRDEGGPFADIRRFLLELTAPEAPSQPSDAAVTDAAPAGATAAVAVNRNATPRTEDDGRGAFRAPAGAAAAERRWTGGASSRDIDSASSGGRRNSR
jgi:acetyl esterase/lipase